MQRRPASAFLFGGIAAVILAIGLIWSVRLATGSLERTVAPASVVRVKGVAAREVTADIGIFSGGVEAEALTLKEAYEKIQPSVAAVRDFLAEAGVPEAAIDFFPPASCPRFKYYENGNRSDEIIAYNMVRNFSVTLTDMALLEKIVREAETLLARGVNLSFAAPSYLVSDIEQYKMDLMGEATRNARERAEQLAENSKAKVGRLNSASQGVIQITAPHSVSVSDSGEYDIWSLKKIIRVVVTAEFTLE